MIVSPLRYPGGKAKLYPFMIELIRDNNLFGRDYCEPYAGGAGLALRLLENGFVDRISLNDIDKSIYAFWYSVLFDTDRFVAKIQNTPITIQEWHIQRDIMLATNSIDALDLGFAAYYLNRTNRSGIIEGAGPIGGYQQSGPWKIDVRLQKEKQISNILGLKRYANYITVSNKDALMFASEKISMKNSFTYLDPPYYIKGKKLYKNFYSHQDHVAISNFLVSNKNRAWVVSYDDVPQIRELYQRFTPITYTLKYSAGRKNTGNEVVFLSNKIRMPDIEGFRVAA